MKNLKLTLLLFGALSAVSATLSAQKTVRICGEYTYYAPENVTLEQARRIALEQAKLEALARQFGTAIHSTTVLTKREDGKNADERFFQLSASDVKGEWLETQGEPAYDKVRYENNLQVVKASVCGKAREVVGAGVDFSAKVLRGGTEARFESGEFKHNDDIFLLFRSPTDGYLAVYLIDAEQTAFCLLPYMGDPTGRVRVKSGRDYIFFSEKHAAPAEKAMVTEYVLTCKSAEEQNSLYVIFSPNEFTKANDSRASSELTLPRELPFDEFQKWLLKNRQRDKDIKVEVKTLTIKQ